MRVILLLAFLVFGKVLFCQTIEFKGLVYEHNSKTKTGKLKLISDAQVIIPRSVPVTTDASGKFKTVSDGLKVGESVEVKLVKDGFQVVNSKELENVIVGRKDVLVVYMASRSELQKAQLEYYNLAKKSIESSHTKKVQELSNELKNAKIQSNEYQLKIKKLESEREAALQSAQNLSVRLSEINLDFAGEILKKAIDYYGKGQIDSCLFMLQSKEYKKAEDKVFNELEDLRSGMSSAGSGIGTIINREFLIAEIYATTLELDSVKQATDRIIKLCLKNSDLLSTQYILKTIKKATRFDPTGEFGWNNEEFFEDLMGLVRIKSGRNTLDEAEVMRMTGYMHMLKQKPVESLDCFKKTLSIYRKINHSDSAMVLINLLDYKNRFFSNEIDPYSSFIQLYTSDDFIRIPYTNNDYWLKSLFPANEDMQYAYSILIDEELQSNNLLTASGLCNSFLRVYSESENKNSFNSNFVDRIKVNEILISAQKNRHIDESELEKALSIIRQTNPNTSDYLYMAKEFSKFMIDNEFLPYIEDEVKKSLHSFCNEVINNLSQEFYNNFNDNIISFDILFSKTTFSFYTYLNSPDEGIDVKFITDNLVSLNAKWLQSNNAILVNYAYYIENLSFEILGCSYDNPGIKLTINGYNSLRDFLKDLAIIMATQNLYRGLDFYKNFILHSIDCELNEETVSELLNIFDQQSENLSNVIDDRARYMIITGYPIERDIVKSYPLGYTYINDIEDFYYGSEYAMNVGKRGVVEEADNWNTTSFMANATNYDSLWVENIQSAKNGKSDIYNHSDFLLHEKSFAIYLQNSIKIDKVKFYGDTVIYGPLIKSPITPAFKIFALYGNSVLFNLDEIYNKLAWHYDDNSIEYGGYSKNLELAEKFQNFGLTNFYLGHSKVNGNNIATTGCILFFGLKSALALNKMEEAKKIASRILELYQQLSEASKVRFLNDVLFLTFYKNQIKDEKNPSYVNFNNAMFNQFYNDLAYLLKNEASWKLDLKGEDKAWPFERDNLILEALLTLSGASQLDNFDPKIFNELKIMFPNEARVYRNEALYYFNLDESKLALLSLNKAIDMGFSNKDFFLNNYAITKHHNKINKLFK